MTKAIDFRYECKIIVINEKQIMKIVNIFVALFCLTACSLSNDLKDRLILKPQSILIDPDKVKDFIDLTPLLRDSVEIIPLETKDECLLSEIERIEFYKDRIFVLDRTRKGVYMFDQSGRFIGKIGCQGSGPGEFTSVGFFCVTGDSVLISDQHQSKWIVYNLQDKRTTEFSCGEFTYLNGFLMGRNLYLVSNYNKSQSDRFNLYKFDVSTRKIEEALIPFEEKMDKYSTTAFTIYASQYQDTAFLIYPFNDTIYEVSSKGAQPFYTIDFTQRNLPDDIEPINNSFRLAVAKGNFVKGLSYMQMSGNYILGRYADKGYFRYLSVDRSTLKSTVGNSFVVRDLGYLPVTSFYTIGDALVSVYSASALMQMLDVILSPDSPIKEKYRTKFESLKQITNCEGNPVLLKFQFESAE